MNAMLSALRVLEPPGKKIDESVSRRQAVYDLQTYDTRGDALMDDLAEAFQANRARILANFEIGDDAENGRLIRNVIFALSDTLHAQHPEDDDR